MVIKNCNLDFVEIAIFGFRRLVLLLQIMYKSAIMDKGLFFAVNMIILKIG